MRIYYFGIYNNNGGLENFAKNLVGTIKQINKRISVTLLVIDEDFSYRSFFESIGCDIVVLPNPHRNPIAFYKKLKSILKHSNKEDVAQLNICSFRNPFLFLACIKSKIKTIVVGHYTKIDDKKFKVVHYINKNIFSKYFICVSNSDDVTKFMFPKKQKIVFINNGIDVDRFSYNESFRKEIRKRLDVKDEVVLIGQVGRVSPEKNQIFSINVFKKIHRTFKNTKLVFVGKEMYLEPRYLADGILEKNSFEFIGPVYDGLEKYYSAFDIILLPSKNEGLSLSMLECCCNGALSFFSKEVPSLRVELPKVHYLDLNEDLWNEKISDEIHKGGINFKRNCYLRGTIYELKKCAEEYIDLYFNYETKKSVG